MDLMVENKIWVKNCLKKLFNVVSENSVLIVLKEIVGNLTSKQILPSYLFRCRPASCSAAVQGCSAFVQGYLPVVQGCSASVQGCLSSVQGFWLPSRVVCVPP